MWPGEREIKIQDSALACFVCPSLKEIFRIFGENIICLKARGGKLLDTNEKELKVLGLKLSMLRESSCVINYNKSYARNYKHDDLDKKNTKLILKYLKQYEIEDCAIEYLKIKIVDGELRKIIQELFPRRKINTNTFFLDFELNMCESDIDKGVWEKTAYNMTVLAPLKFKRSILHCVRMVDEDQLWAVKRAQRNLYIDWRPEIRKSLIISPKDIALSIMKNLEPYGYVKIYKYSKDKQLKLVSMK